MPKHSNPYWYKHDYHRFAIQTGRLHTNCVGILVRLADWHAAHHAGLLNQPIPGDLKELANLIGCESATEKAHLAYVVQEFCTTTTRRGKTTLTVNYMRPILAERTEIIEKARENGRKGGRPSEKPAGYRPVSGRVPSGKQEQNRTEQRQNREQKGATAPSLTLSERGSLFASLSETQKAALRAKGIDPAAFCRKFEAHHEGEAKTEAAWRRTLARWLATEKPAAPNIRPTLTTIAARPPMTAEEIAAADAERERRLDASRKAGEQRLRELAAKMRTPDPTR